MIMANMPCRTLWVLSLIHISLQLVLARRHLHQAGVGVDKDAVEVVHLDVGLQPDLLLAAQGAACLLYTSRCV